MTFRGIREVGIFDEHATVPPVPGKPTIGVRMRKMAALFHIRDVESVRLLQDCGYLDYERNADDLFREITTGERRDPETQWERDLARLKAEADALLADQAADSPHYIDDAYRDDAR